jgi:7-cyano-7-deazaguanine reductase
MAEAEGKRLPFLSEDHIDVAVLETFPYVGPRQRITYTTSEFSAVCPFSGLPDIATIVIDYVPNELCVELKSLKYYFLSYRSVGIYQEPATARIYEDLHKLMKPFELKVSMTYNTRGGIDATSSVSSKDQ